MCKNDVKIDRRYTATMWVTGVLAVIVSFSISYIMLSWVVTRIAACVAIAAFSSGVALSIASDFGFDRLARKAKCHGN